MATIRRIATHVGLAIGLLFLASGLALAEQPYRGVAPWQAERAIKDFVRVFSAQQVLTNDYSKIRVRVSDVRRVYNKDVGWIVVAIFEGAVVPDVYKPGQTQPYFHGILKISADAKGRVQNVVVNEGAGLWKMTATSAQLHEELREELGGWKDWGGNPNDIPPSSTTGTATGTPGGATAGPSGSHSTSNSGNQAIQALAAAMNAAKKKCQQTGDPQDCQLYYALYKKYTAQMANP